MQKTSLGLLIFLLFASLAWGVERDYAGCNREQSNFGDDLETFAAQEQFTVPMGSEMMQVTAARNGGVRLVGGSGQAYEVTVCKYAGANDQSEADAILRQITVEHSSGAIAVRGPEGSRWVASLIIKVPQGANMSVSAHNGPVSAREASGTFKLDTVNGPISVKQVSGTVTATAENGPISFSGETGNHNLHTENGPIAIELADRSWQNGKLEARASNGPVALKLPRGYQSGVLVTADGHAPMSCDADICQEARKTWEGDEKRIEFGPSSPVIRISTHNGPVSVSTREATM